MGPSPSPLALRSSLSLAKHNGTLALTTSFGSIAVPSYAQGSFRSTTSSRSTTLTRQDWSAVSESTLLSRVTAVVSQLGSACRAVTKSLLAACMPYLVPTVSALHRTHGYSSEYLQPACCGLCSSAVPPSQADTRAATDHRPHQTQLTHHSRRAAAASTHTRAEPHL